MKCIEQCSALHGSVSPGLSEGCEADLASLINSVCAVPFDLEVIDSVCA
jgi:hypothetical protein